MTARWNRAMRGRHALLVGLAACIACAGRGRSAGGTASGTPITDSTFAEVQVRGEHVMGVDQSLAQHVFETLPDGGRIILAWPDTSGEGAAEVVKIRQHMREIATAFAGGDFSSPFQVHATDVPGTAMMRERRSTITYRATDIPGGAEVRIATGDTAAAAAVAEFLAFQRNEHRAEGHLHPAGGSPMDDGATP